MGKSRLEAFSDGVMAIIITVMVLELRVPHGVDMAALRSLAPVFCAYALSFTFVGIYWNNHHHMLHLADRIDGRILWANLHLLFWLSLIPFGTAWMGENHAAPLPTAVYGLILLLDAVAYTILQAAIIASQGAESRLRKAVERDVKGKLSLLAYLVAIPLAFWNPWVAISLYVTVALIWLVPDPRITAQLEPRRSSS